jgi:RNA polymerase sigma-70 factor (ECF subfamily)
MKEARMGDDGNDDDFGLLARWRAGGDDAGQRLFERYFAGVCRFFHSKVTDGVDDLVQRTFLACVEGRDRFRGDGSFRSYLFGVAHNVLRSSLRERKRDAFDSSVTSAADLGPSASSIVVMGQEQRLLLEALRRIPLDYQIVLELHYWEHLTGPELAAVLEVPEGTVRGRLRRGRERLEEALREIASSSEVLESTMTNLDDWARSLRQLLGEDQGGTRDRKRG